MSVVTETPYSYKESLSFRRRLEASKKVREAYPDRVPVIVEKHLNSTLPDISVKKFLVPADIPIAKFLCEVKKHIPITPEQSVFLFVGNNTIPPSGSLMEEVYAQHVDEDGMLYITYSGENVFG
eukprot:CAMPEP_0177655088 /NCGR_PEP_ID=MMETSP0447-20121125/14743_1 /TAXON_ID=0 /ORGANISM="Stygamoeba regulata, Strain BSH-02190019" /LENGTH=123 /DNA_ID=CAMNT_0019158909 /DNA_START=66 /DNA_END=437 /DNA_ORIENTATION=-